MYAGMAALKLNVLHWHLTDAHSFPFGSDEPPDLGTRGAFHPSLVYTPRQMRTVVAAAHERGIRVVPELDMPGVHGRQHAVCKHHARHATDA